VAPHIVACPTCNGPVEWTEASPWRPFCSERCRLIDLGAWISEQRGIGGEDAPDSDAPAEPEPGHGPTH
jgi:endogenous inhibitor of DNA gyrase (YacG/DUF329 family)